MAADPYRHFRIEAAEIHAELGKGVLELERAGPVGDLVARLLRLAHTLKGAARVVKLPEIAEHTHAIEDLLEPLRTAPADARAPIEALLGHIDGIGARVAALQAPAPSAITPAVPSPAARPPEDAWRLVRADVAEMDALLEGIGEAQTQLGALRRARLSVERARHVVDLLVEQLTNPRAAREKMISFAQEIQDALAQVDQEIVRDVDQLDVELSQIRGAAEQMRLTPARVLFSGLERTARDAARVQGKAVAFECRGGDVRLDAGVLGVLQGALVQLVRNAVAHGVEAETERRAAGKPPAGSVSIEVARRGRNVVLTCRDDGRGIDVESVRHEARRKGREGVESMPLVDLLLRGGVSTTGTVTEIAGRGIGLDVLREAAERVAGAVRVETVAGKGTRFEVVVPLSLASIAVLLVEAHGTAVGIPLDAVRRTARIVRADLATTEGGESLVVDGTALPFVPLTQLLAPGVESVPVAAWTVVVVEGESGRAALGVDRLGGTAHVIQRPLPDLAPATPLVGGTAMDATGNPRLILDPIGLVAAARAPHAAPAAATTRRERILVVDDSLTTRMLEQSILESAGYDVEVAASAEEALDKVSTTRYALMLVDVEMPGMDGFTFIEHIRADPALRQIPCILVTSRASPDDRRRGHDVGAAGYVDKGEFDQNALLDRIRSLTG